VNGPDHGIVYSAIKTTETFLASAPIIFIDSNYYLFYFSNNRSH